MKCAVPDCTKERRSTKYCGMHYRRLWEYGDLNFTKTEKHNMSKTPEWHVWVNMIQRCTNSNNPRFADYGGRGIKVCERWLNSLSAFIEDMGKKPKGLTLERINNDGNYEPRNCRWATVSEQNLNKRIYSNNTTGYKGIDIAFGKYRVRYKNKLYGYFRTLEDAINARKLAEQEYK